MNIPQITNPQFIISLRQQARNYNTAADLLERTNPGTNLRTIGRKLSAETRRKMSLAHKKRRMNLHQGGTIKKAA